MGSGGVGGYFGGRLAEHGQDVHFVARGEQLQAMRSRGLTVRSHQRGLGCLRLRHRARSFARGGQC